MEGIPAMTRSQTADIDTIRAGLAGAGAMIATPFGARPLVYADYTASGRAYRPIEDEIAGMAAMLANPHTEDSATGRASNGWLREAEAAIKAAVNAGPDHALIPCGNGATTAIHKLQEILGVAVPPATRAAILDAAETAFGAEGRERLEAELKARAPVVFLGPYEHHSNELSWREGLAEIVRVPLCGEGGLDLSALDRLLALPEYRHRRKIGAFSAASNVTGVRTDVPALARLLHRHGAILCLDAAASAPYLPIDMAPGDSEARIDAVSLSPHKFVGGPGSCGLLLLDKSLYPKGLAPTVSAGGTVRYVWAEGHDFIEDVEAREKAGTPGLPQLVRAARALQLVRSVGADTIAAREHAALERVFSDWADEPGIDVLGPACPSRRIGIVSFNIRDPRGGWLHPRFVTTLLSDLFGIQARAGCACAGPYAHDLLGIDAQETAAYRRAVLEGHGGMRPGWSRISLHWTMSPAEIGYLSDAVRFVARQGWKFLDLYRFDLATGAWAWSTMSTMLERPRDHVEKRAEPCSFERALEEARSLACALHPCGDVPHALPEPCEALRRFSLPVQPVEGSSGSIQASMP
jgi:selenocysteine lyase/cysteine desulfurase